MDVRDLRDVRDFKVSFIDKDTRTIGIVSVDDYTIFDTIQYKQTSFDEVVSAYEKYPETCIWEWVDSSDCGAKYYFCHSPHITTHVCDPDDGIPY